MNYFYTVILGAIAGMWLGNELGWNESTGPVIGTLAGIIIGFGAVVRVGRSPKIRREMTPAITAIVVESRIILTRISCLS